MEDETDIEGHDFHAHDLVRVAEAVEEKDLTGSRICQWRSDLQKHKTTVSARLGESEALVGARLLVKVEGLLRLEQFCSSKTTRDEYLDIICTEMTSHFVLHHLCAIHSVYVARKPWSVDNRAPSFILHGDRDAVPPPLCQTASSRQQCLVFLGC